MPVHQKIRTYLHVKGIAQETVALKAGLAPESFNEILNGNREMDALLFRSICIAIKVVPEVFIDYELTDDDLL
jgi:transcriptional regulator with XRE-family HTH domain